MFFHFLEIRNFCICLAVFVIGFWLFRIVRSKKIIVRLPMRIIAIGFIGLGLFAFLIFGCGELVTSTSAPIYSPDHKHALRIENMDEGAVGGDTFVNLYGGFGFHQSTIFAGEFKMVEVKDIRWTSNSEVLVNYHYYDSPTICENAQGVTVRCEKALEPVR